MQIVLQHTFLYLSLLLCSFVLDVFGPSLFLKVIHTDTMEYLILRQKNKLLLFCVFTNGIQCSKINTKCSSFKVWFFFGEISQNYANVNVLSTLFYIGVLCLNDDQTQINCRLFQCRIKHWQYPFIGWCKELWSPCIVISCWGKEIWSPWPFILTYLLPLYAVTM